MINICVISDKSRAAQPIGIKVLLEIKFEKKICSYIRNFAKFDNDRNTIKNFMKNINCKHNFDALSLRYYSIFTKIE